MRSVYRLIYIAIMLDTVRKLVHRFDTGYHGKRLIGLPDRLPDAIVADTDSITDSFMKVAGVKYGEKYILFNEDWGGCVSIYEWKPYGYRNQKNNERITPAHVLCPITAYPDAFRVCEDAMHYIKLMW